MSHKGNNKGEDYRYAKFRVPQRNDQLYQIIKPERYFPRMRAQWKFTIDNLEEDGIIEPYDGQINATSNNTIKATLKLKSESETRLIRDYRYI